MVGNSDERLAGESDEPHAVTARLAATRPHATMHRRWRLTTAFLSCGNPICGLLAELFHSDRRVRIRLRSSRHRLKADRRSRAVIPERKNVASVDGDDHLSAVLLGP